MTILTSPKAINTQDCDQRSAMIVDHGRYMNKRRLKEAVYLNADKNELWTRTEGWN